MTVPDPTQKNIVWVREVSLCLRSIMELFQKMSPDEIIQCIWDFALSSLKFPNVDWTANELVGAILHLNVLSHDLIDLKSWLWRHGVTTSISPEIHTHMHAPTHRPLHWLLSAVSFKYQRWVAHSKLITYYLSARLSMVFEQTAAYSTLE